MENNVRYDANNQEVNKPQFLQRGDIIRLEAGMAVYADVPSMYRGGSFFDTRNTHTDIVIGQTYKKPAKTIAGLAKEIFGRIKYVVPVSMEQITTFLEGLNLDLEERHFDTSIYAGEYKVIFATYNGGSSTFDGGYPDGWHVFCQKVDNPSMEVDFYQTGCFTAMISDIKPINK